MKFKSIQTQFLVISVVIILVAVAVVGGIASYTVTQQSENDYFSNSNEQMKIAEKSIKIFYDQIDKDINMMATNPLVMESENSGITSYVNNTEKVQMTPSKNGGIEQEIYEVFDHYAKNHPGTMYVYFGTENGAYLQWPETKVPSEKFNPPDKGWYKTGLSGSGAIMRTEPYVDGISNTML